MFLLKFFNEAYKETWYLRRLGHPHPLRPDLWPVEVTTRDISAAATFSTLKDALEVWVKAGSPPYWSVLEMEGGKIVREIET